MFVRRGIAEKDEFGIPETADDEPVVAIDDLRDAALKGTDHLAQILESDTMGSPRHADQLARHGSDLAAFGVSMRRWCGVPRGVELRRRHDAFLHFRDDWPDESIPAAGHGLDPTGAAGSVA